MNLLTTDLNLLVALDALLQEQNVTRAGERIGISQPSMSSALRRLRNHFNDELLSRVGRGYSLTPLAYSMKDEVSEVIHMVEHTMLDRRRFDPDTSTRRFEIITSDYGMTVMGPALMRNVKRVAPNVQVQFDSVRPDTLANAREVLLKSDFLLMPRECKVNLPSIKLFRDRWVCISGHPRKGQRLTLEDLATADWARMYGAPGGRTISADQRVGRIVPNDRTGVIVDSFFMLPFAVTGTDRMALLQERLALKMLEIADIEVLILPVVLPPLMEAAWWHPARDSDPGHVWMREVLQQTAAEIEPDSGRPTVELDLMLGT
jgi:DNA-binding transcriptional LysR family regulator